MTSHTSRRDAGALDPIEPLRLEVRRGAFAIVGDLQPTSGLESGESRILVSAGRSSARSRGESRFRRLSRRSRLLRLLLGGLGRVRPHVLAAEGRRDFRLPGAGQPRILAFARPALANYFGASRTCASDTGTRPPTGAWASFFSTRTCAGCRPRRGESSSPGTGACSSGRTRTMRFRHARAPASSAVHQQPRHVRHDPRAARLRAAVHAVGEDPRHGFGPRPQLRALRARGQDLPRRRRRGRAPAALREGARRRHADDLFEGAGSARSTICAFAPGRTPSRSKSAASRRRDRLRHDGAFRAPPDCPAAPTAPAAPGASMSRLGRGDLWHRAAAVLGGIRRPGIPPGDARRPCLVIGHRGAAKLEVENTVASYRRALELGADTIEADLSATADGRFALWHDADPDERVALARQLGAERLAYRPRVPEVGSRWRRPVRELRAVDLAQHYGYESEGSDSRKRSPASNGSRTCSTGRGRRGAQPDPRHQARGRANRCGPGARRSPAAGIRALTIIHLLCPRGPIVRALAAACAAAVPSISA